MTISTSVPSVWKGHGTGNDFVIIDDLEGQLDLTIGLVRALCDRHFGVGADGVLRVVRSENEPAAAAMATDAPFFMDYRNSDGSIAEMCGNGIRLFALYLRTRGLSGDRVSIATRGGIRRVVVTDRSEITVEMGPAQVLVGAQSITPRGSDRRLAGVGVLVPNPHVVVELGSERELAGLDLSASPAVEPGLADGQNVEFVVRTGPRRIALRVYERGSGETCSCGTGICAAVVALASSAAGLASPQDGVAWQVDVPGGSCQVRWCADGELLLTGPATLVGQVSLDSGWFADHVS